MINILFHFFRRNLNSNGASIITNGFNGVTNAIVESKLDDVKFDFNDSGSHIYDDPELLLSSIHEKGSYDMLQFSNSTFEPNEKALYNEIPCDGLTWSKKMPPSDSKRKEAECDSSQASKTISASSSSSKVSPVPTTPNYDVPRRVKQSPGNCTTLISKIKTVENDYQELTKEVSQVPSSAVNDHFSTGTMPSSNSLPPLVISSRDDSPLDDNIGVPSIGDDTKEEDQYMDMNSPNLELD